MPDRPAFARLGLAKADVRHTAWPCLLLAGEAEAHGHRQREAGQAQLSHGPAVFCHRILGGRGALPGRSSRTAQQPEVRQAGKHEHAMPGREANGGIARGCWRSDAIG